MGGGAMFEHTRPAELDPLGGPDPWAEFRVGAPQERLRLLRELRDASVPVILNAPDGAALASQIWAVDTAQSRLNFSTERRNARGKPASGRARRPVAAVRRHTPAHRRGR